MFNLLVLLPCRVCNSRSRSENNEFWSWFRIAPFQMFGQTIHSHMMQVTWCRSHDAGHMMQVTWCRSHDAGHMTQVTWYRSHDAGHMMQGVMEYSSTFACSIGFDKAFQPTCARLQVRIVFTIYTSITRVCLNNPIYCFCVHAYTFIWYRLCKKYSVNL